jgi:membrane fusion protein, multidrug efflux system
MSSGTHDSAPKPRRVAFVLGAVAIAAAGSVFFGVGNRARSKQEVTDWSNQQAIATVRIVRPEPGAQEDSLVLPGNVSAFYVATLFARATGYVTSWSNDIGARVSRGQTLATIAAPDLDQQLEQAKAELVQLNAAVQQAQANADLGKVTDQRTSKLVMEGWSSQAQGDTDRLTAAARDAALTVAKANVVAQQAAVNRLTELAGFEQIKAPFDGVVTARNVDIGNLVTADGASGSALFQVADIHRMRVYVNVPQAFLGDLHPGIKATLHVPGQKQTFEAELVSLSNALVANSRTGLVELQADNPDGKLWPGAFAEVQFHIPADSNAVSIPSTAVNSTNKVELKPVIIGRDLGNKVEIQSGLTTADRLVDNPLESIQNGDEVHIADATSKSPATVALDKID